MTYELIYDRQTYQLTFDPDGQPAALYHLQPTGPALHVDLTTIPSWLVDKLQDHWQAQHDYDLQEMQQALSKPAPRFVSHLHKRHA